MSLALSASHMIDYQRQITPLAAAIEQVGTLADPPSWRGRASASFDRSSWGASTTLNYTNSYLEDGQPAQCSRLLAAGLRILRCAQGAGHGASIRQATSQRMFAAPERG